MHAFSHPLDNEIKLIFTQHAFHLKYIKELYVFKICQWLAKFQKPKYGNKLNEVMLLLNSFTRNNHHFNNVIFTPTNSQPFILGMLTISRHEILTHNKSRACDFAFFLISMFYKWSNLGTNKFSLPSTSLQTLQWTMLNFPSHPTTTLAQSHFVINTFWKIQFNSHSFSCISFMQVWDLEIENWQVH